MVNDFQPTVAVVENEEFDPQAGRVLIVDDNPTNLGVLSDVLDQAGWEVSIAKSGQKALDRVPLVQPDLILLDVMMPGINGFETCERLKADPTTREIPVIFMTALADVGSKVKGLELGAVDYITKPFQQAEVLARGQTHLRLYQLKRQVQQTLIRDQFYTRFLFQGPVGIPSRLLPPCYRPENFLLLRRHLHRQQQGQQQLQQLQQQVRYRTLLSKCLLIHLLL